MVSRYLTRTQIEVLKDLEPYLIPPSTCPPPVKELLRVVGTNRHFCLNEL